MGSEILNPWGGIQSLIDHALIGQGQWGQVQSLILLACDVL